jgi:hypothetical protein
MRVSSRPCLLAFLLAAVLVSCGDIEFFFVSNPGVFEDLDETGGIIIVVSSDDDDEAVQSVSLVDGEIPPGTTLTNDGRLIGTAEQSGLFEFTIEIVSIDGDRELRTITLEIEDH